MIVPEGCAPVLLIQLAPAHQPRNVEPLAIGALAGALADHGLATMLLQIAADEEAGAIGSAIKSSVGLGTRIVGLSVPQGTRRLANDVYTRAVARFGELGIEPLVVFGNSLPTADPASFVNLGERCMAIRGWGEVGLCELARQVIQHRELKLHAIPGLSYSIQGSVVNNPIDSSSVWCGSGPPVRIGEPRAYFRRVEASRGCHFGVCSFCARPPGRATSWEPAPIGRVERDVEALVAQGVREFTFTDEDLVGNDPARLRVLMRRLMRHSPLMFTASFRAGSLVRTEPGGIDFELISVLREAGLQLAFIGVESLSESQLARYGKRQDPSLVVSVVEALEASGIEVEIGNIPFDPRVSLSELRESTGRLMTSGLFRNLGTPFGAMRVQQGTALARSLGELRKRDCDDDEFLTFGWKFAHDEVTDLFAWLDRWWAPLDRAYLLARNLSRTGVFGPAERRVAAENLIAIRAQSMDILSAGLTYGPMGVDTEDHLTRGRSMVLSCLRRIGIAATRLQAPVPEVVLEYLAELARLGLMVIERPRSVELAG